MNQPQTHVTGRIHLLQFRKYWETVMRPAALVLRWLKTGVPLYPYGTLDLAMHPDPPEYRFSMTEEEWTRQAASIIASESNRIHGIRLSESSKASSHKSHILMRETRPKEISTNNRSLAVECIPSSKVIPFRGAQGLASISRSELVDSNIGSTRRLPPCLDVGRSPAPSRILIQESLVQIQSPFIQTLPSSVGLLQNCALVDRLMAVTGDNLWESRRRLLLCSPRPGNTCQNSGFCNCT